MRTLIAVVLLGSIGACGEEEPTDVAQTAAGGTGNVAGSSSATGGTPLGGTGGAQAGAGGGPTGSYCAVWESRLRECALLGMGRYAGCTTHADQAEVCEVACIASAPCSAIAAFLCGFGDEIFDCKGACIGELPVVCGDGSRFSFDYRCDGFDDCPQGEDEMGCTGTNTTKCRNVAERIPNAALCDGNPDCSDGSDEPAGCSAVFTCSDSTVLPAIYACDGFVDCPDRSDEPSDCAVAGCN